MAITGVVGVKTPRLSPENQSAIALSPVGLICAKIGLSLRLAGLNALKTTLRGGLMMLSNRLADGSEATLRDLQRSQIRQFTVGDPLIGSMFGLLGFGLAWTVSKADSPYDLWAMVLVVVGMLALFDFVGKRLDEPVGDLANRALTRIFGFPWVPFQFRRSFNWNWEPWSTPFIASFLVFVLAMGPSANVEFPMLMGSGWITSIVMGAVLALVKDLSSKDSRTRLMGRGGFRIR